MRREHWIFWDPGNAER